MNTAEQTLRIKGMVCRRCIATVKDIFMQEGFTVTKINLGEVNYFPSKADASIDMVKDALLAEGFEVLDDRQSRMIGKVKELVANLWNSSGPDGPGLDSPEASNKNLSTLISEALNTDYDAVSALFTVTEGFTLEHYVIGKRIEKARQLLAETNLSFTDIAYQLGYSSVHHFSNQFKKITGMSPSSLKKILLEKAKDSV